MECERKKEALQTNWELCQIFSAGKFPEQDDEIAAWSGRLLDKITTLTIKIRSSLDLYFRSIMSFFVSFFPPSPPGPPAP